MRSNRFFAILAIESFWNGFYTELHANLRTSSSF